MKKLKDKDGNLIIINQIQDFNASQIILALKGQRKRNIGVIRNDILYIERYRSRHLYRKMSAYGFNYELIHNTIFPYKYIKIKILDEGKTYKIKRSLVRKKGTYLYHKKEGFELQMFLSENLIKNETKH